MQKNTKMKANGKTQTIYLLDELLEINDFRMYTQGIIEMVARKIDKRLRERKDKKVIK